jgi:transcriptional antiterminator RfaH
MHDWRKMMELKTEKALSRQAKLDSPTPAPGLLTSGAEALTPDGQLPTPNPQPLTPPLRWFVVQANPREEQRAQHFLEEKGFQTYLPRMEAVTVRSFKSITVQKPLFPGYLFCFFDPNESLAFVRWTKGVKKLLPESVCPVPVEEHVVDAIRSLEHRDGVIRKQPLQKNDKVRIARGPLKDILGIFDHWSSDQGRVRVLLNFISYQASVELHHSLLERVA